MKEYFNRLYTDTAESFYKILDDRVKKNIKTFIITANPESFMFAENDKVLEDAILDKDTLSVPDGVGIVKASRMLNINVKERIPGIDIANRLLVIANKYKKSIYFYGAKEEVLIKLKEMVIKNYPNIKIAGSQNGYVSDKDKVFDDIVKCKPDIVLVALGIPLQEKLIYSHLDKFSKGIFVGVGGSFDVMSGSKKRAPKLFIKLNIEWLYRIVSEPKRIKRFWNSNVKFIFNVRKLRSKND